MGEVVDLKPATLVEDHQFVADLARFREGLLDEKAIRKKYRLAESAWEKLGDDDELIRKVEEESVRRIRDGSSKREKSQQFIVKAPAILDSIMSDTTQNARHRIDWAKTLNEFASHGPESSAPAGDRFIITINLGSDTLRFDKSIVPDPNDVDPNHPDDMPMIAGIAMNKPRDDGSGNPL